MKYRFDSYYLDSPIVKGRIFDLFLPEGEPKDIAVFIVHGGGWRAGSRASFHFMMERLADGGYAAASADYRLDAPDAFVQLSDLREAYAAFVRLLKEKGVKPRIVVYGESAGAHLASLLSYTSPGECGEKCALSDEWVPPVRVILQAAPVDFCPYEAMMDSTRAMMESAAGAPYEKDPERYERLSLKNYIRESNPPTFFMEAELEHLFSSENTYAVYQRHLEFGILSQYKVYPGMEHGFLYALTRSAQREALSDIFKFLEGEKI